jgi:hypothetical protein
MAQEITIPGTTSTAKVRSPWAPALLPYVTFLIYLFVWYYKINREMADLGKARGTDELGDNPGKSVLAVTLGAFIIVPAVISTINTGKRIQAAQRLAGVEPQMNGWLAVVMGLLITPVLYAYEQSELNKVWKALSGGEPQLAAGGGAAVAQPAAPAAEPVPAPTPPPADQPPQA